MCENGFDCAKRVEKKKKDVFGMDLAPATDEAGKSCVNIWKWKPVAILLKKKTTKTKDEQLKIKKNGKRSKNKMSAFQITKYLKKKNSDEVRWKIYQLLFLPTPHLVFQIIFFFLKFKQ